LSHDEQANLENVLRLAKAFAENPQDWLMLTGGYGTGKTHLAAAIANYQTEHGNTVMFMAVPDLLDYLRATFNPAVGTSFDQRFEQVRTTPLLVLDDLGTESATSWAREKLYQIINHRYVAHLPTVITTSVRPDELDPRIRIRILDATHCMILPLIMRGYHDGPTARRSKPARTPTR
jgi:DNA replication protein DnaC